MSSQSKRRKKRTVPPEDSAFLVSTDLFAAIPENTKEEILACLTPVTVRAGDRFIHQGAEGDCLYIIQKGSCSIIEERGGKTGVIARRTSGELVGEMAMLTGETRTAHVDAETDMSLWRISRVEFDALCLAYPAIREFVTDLMMKRISQSESSVDRTVGQFFITELDKSNRKLAMLIERCRAMESQLTLNEQRLRALIANAEDCIFIKDMDLKYTHVNPAMLELLRRSEQDVVGKIDVDFFPPEDARYFNDLELRVLMGQSVESEHVIRVGNESRTYKMSRFPMRDDSGRTVGICGIGRDTTERTQIGTEPKAEAGHYPSKAMRETLRQLRLVAKSDSTVLFLGESGSGKDYLARYLHEQSKRAGGPFLSINCPALPSELVESELFGHEAGAFTGAHGRKRGLVELAEGGTLLLNEIGDLPLRLQPRLLTFLDTAEFLRVGGEKSLSVNARIVAATNRDLKKEVANGNFREDLFHRLNVFSIQVPPLRERREDLPLLVEEILQSLVRRFGLSHVPRVELEAVEALAIREWPGNVRELSNLLERGLILSDKNRITARDLGLSKSDPVQLDGNDISVFLRLSETGSFHKAVIEAKRRLLGESLRHSGGSIKEAAELLKISRDSFVHHMRTLGVSK
jgi:PAS domain S-box-containing protein